MQDESIRVIPVPKGGHAGYHEGENVTIEPPEAFEDLYDELKFVPNPPVKLQKPTGECFNSSRDAFKALRNATEVAVIEKRTGIHPDQSSFGEYK